MVDLFDRASDAKSKQKELKQQRYEELQKKYRGEVIKVKEVLRPYKNVKIKNDYKFKNLLQKAAKTKVWKWIKNNTAKVKTFFGKLKGNNKNVEKVEEVKEKANVGTLRARSKEFSSNIEKINNEIKEINSQIKGMQKILADPFFPDAMRKEYANKVVELTAKQKELELKSRKGEAAKKVTEQELIKALPGKLDVIKSIKKEYSEEFRDLTNRKTLLGYRIYKANELAKKASDPGPYNITANKYSEELALTDKRLEAVEKELKKLERQEARAKAELEELRNKE